MLWVINNFYQCLTHKGRIRSLISICRKNRTEYISTKWRRLREASPRWKRKSNSSISTCDGCKKAREKWRIGCQITCGRKIGVLWTSSSVQRRNRYLTSRSLCRRTRTILIVTSALKNKKSVFTTKTIRWWWEWTRKALAFLLFRIWRSNTSKANGMLKIVGNCQPSWSTKKNSKESYPLLRCTKAA